MASRRFKRASEWIAGSKEENVQAGGRRGLGAVLQTGAGSNFLLAFNELEKRLSDEDLEALGGSLNLRAKEEWRDKGSSLTLSVSVAELLLAAGPKRAVPCILEKRVGELVFTEGEDGVALSNETLALPWRYGKLGLAKAASEALFESEPHGAWWADGPADHLMEFVVANADCPLEEAEGFAALEMQRLAKRVGSVFGGNEGVGPEDLPDFPGGVSMGNFGKRGGMCLVPVEGWTKSAVMAAAAGNAAWLGMLISGGFKPGGASVCAALAGGRPALAQRLLEERLGAGEEKGAELDRRDDFMISRASRSSSWEPERREGLLGGLSSAFEEKARRIALSKAPSAKENGWDGPSKKEGLELESFCMRLFDAFDKGNGAGRGIEESVLSRSKVPGKRSGKKVSAGSAKDGSNDAAAARTAQCFFALASATGSRAMIEKWLGNSWDGAVSNVEGNVSMMLRHGSVEGFAVWAEAFARMKRKAGAAKWRKFQGMVLNGALESDVEVCGGKWADRGDLTQRRYDALALGFSTGCFPDGMTSSAFGVMIGMDRNDQALLDKALLNCQCERARGSDGPKGSI